MKSEQENEDRVLEDDRAPRPGRWRLLLGLTALCLIAVVLWWLISLPEASDKQDATAEVHSEAPVQPVDSREQPAMASGDLSDFAVNPYLERMIGSPVQSSDHLVTAKATMTGTDFRMTGEIRTTSSDRCVIFIYSNKGQDYLDESPILRRLLELKPGQPTQEKSNTGETLRNYTFSFGITMQQIPGLYYYIVASEKKEEPLLVGKFTIN